MVPINKHYSLRSVTADLLVCLDSYGASELEMAITEALSRQAAHPHTVRLILEKRRQALKQQPPLSLTLPHDVRLREVAVRPHALNTYDQLTPEKKHDQSE